MRRRNGTGIVYEEYANMISNFEDDEIDKNASGKE
jgi:hypothetical protein